MLLQLIKRIHLKDILIGNNHTISNLYINNNNTYLGLFGYNEGLIENLILDNSSIKSNCTYVGGITAYNIRGTIKNCKNYAQITNAQDSGGVGGIVGYGDNTKIIKCSNYGKIDGKSGCMGGIIGYAFGTEIEQSINYSEIENSDGSCTGGIVGCGQSVKITECYNRASITGDIQIGGIAGAIAGFMGIYDCYNLGTIRNISEPEENCTYIGGICGYVGLYSEKDKIENCYNLGELENVCQNAEKEAYIGELTGFYESGVINNCYMCNKHSSIGKFSDSATQDNINIVTITQESIKTKEICNRLDNNRNTWKYDFAEMNGGNPVLKYEYDDIKNANLKGDINQDKKVNISDIIGVIRHISSKKGDKYSLKATAQIIADINDDEKINIADVIGIIRIIAK